MKELRPIELLAPAKNLTCGIEAINHGADAVYIGAPKFGARASAGNSLDDIRELVDYAHLFRARIYVTINTILSDEELKETEDLIWQLYRIGVDALIVQDMGITMLNLPPIPLHASTQTDNRTVERVRFLSQAGFSQVVLARELTLHEIQDIHRACPEVALEAFVHGALCVSYSGQCYASAACFGRSANRGECAQFCRLPFNLVDAEGKEIMHEKYLLSLKDLNQIDQLEHLLDAGVTSLKIEGRLKEVTYVKNVTAAYRERLDSIFGRRPEFVRSSSGQSDIAFTPRLEKSFNRGFTSYFLNGRDRDLVSFDTPKSMGEEMGYVKEQRGNYVVVAGVKPFHNGDGICYVDETGKLQGIRVNKAEHNKLYLNGAVPRIKPRTVIYRNFDHQFDHQLSLKSAERKLRVRWTLSESAFGFAVEAEDEDACRVTLSFETAKEKARSPQRDNIVAQLTKLGNTPFKADERDVHIGFAENWFIPSSQLADWRRKTVDELVKARRINYPRVTTTWKQTHHPFETTRLSYLGNVMNRQAAAFYRQHGVEQTDPAFEKQPDSNAVLMFCRHCIRYSLGWCPVYQTANTAFKEPYYLVGTDGKRFRLEFDCKNCQMKVRKAE